MTHRNLETALCQAWPWMLSSDLGRCDVTQTSFPIQKLKCVSLGTLKILASTCCDISGVVVVFVCLDRAVQTYLKGSWSLRNHHLLCPIRVFSPACLTGCGLCSGSGWKGLTLILSVNQIRAALGFFLQRLIKWHHLLNGGSSKNRWLKSQWIKQEKNSLPPWDLLYLLSSSNDRGMTSWAWEQQCSLPLSFFFSLSKKTIKSQP